MHLLLFLFDLILCLFQLAASLGARAVSHLEEVSDAGIKAMAEAGSVAVLLPTTAYILRLKTPPARQMISEGVAVALGSDFNPNAYCLSMVKTKCIVPPPPSPSISFCSSYFLFISYPILLSYSSSDLSISLF